MWIRLLRRIGGVNKVKSSFPINGKCALVDAGRISYATGLSLQRQARDLVEGAKYDGIIILLEHEPVITVGRGGGQENLLVEECDLNANGVELFKSNRGGNITGHNPGQLVVYPILNLKKWKQDIHWYVRTLEEVIIRVLAHFQLIASRKSDHTGIWINDAKVAAIGVFVSHWITSHGLALNVNNDLGIFKSMVPCGIRCFGVTNLTEVGIQVEMKEVKSLFVREFKKLFKSGYLLKKSNLFV
ncbi:MAG: lipoyl(octanoyl) transferase LipB [Desulfuromusa sp.]